MCAHPSFDMTPTFRENSLRCQQIQITCIISRCHSKRRMGTAMLTNPPFCMTMTFRPLGTILGEVTQILHSLKKETPRLFNLKF